MHLILFAIHIKIRRVFARLGSLRETAETINEDKTKATVLQTDNIDQQLQELKSSYATKKQWP